MTHIPTVKRAVLRPASEALPPQLAFTERVLRSIPIVSWFVGPTKAPSGGGGTGEIIGNGPVLKEDGSWDEEKNGVYWRFWHAVDEMLGTDFCGLRDE